MREQIIEALKKHAEGHIEKHKANVEVLLQKTAGIAEHPDVLETIEKELKIIAEYDDELQMLDKYFTKKEEEKTLVLRPKIPTLKLIAFEKSWIRLKDQKGDIFYERNLKKGEEIIIPNELFSGSLRALKEPEKSSLGIIISSPFFRFLS